MNCLYSDIHLYTKYYQTIIPHQENEREVCAKTIVTATSRSVSGIHVSWTRGRESKCYQTALTQSYEPKHY